MEDMPSYIAWARASWIERFYVQRLIFSLAQGLSVTRPLHVTVANKLGLRGMLCSAGQGDESDNAPRSKQGLRNRFSATGWGPQAVKFWLACHFCVAVWA